MYRYAQSVARAEDDEAARAMLRGRYGEEALIDLALGVASARVFPTVKRALGYATSYSLVRLDV